MDALDRMFRRLVQIIRHDYPEYLGRPIEVGELYQNIIPYRLHRRELALDTNQDYEMAMLELLSGARGYVAGDATMQDALRRELTSPNPDPGAFREYSTEYITLSADAVRRMDGAGGNGGVSTPAGGSGAAGRPSNYVARGPSPSVSMSAATAPFAGSAAAAAPPPAPPAPVAPPPPRPAPPPAPTAPRAAAPAPAPPAPAAPAPPAPAKGVGAAAGPHKTVSASAVGGSCRYCGGGLPDGRRITFCPHCGQNLTVQHCPACNSELELGWKFCVTCGRAAGA
jgi:hypothetical protein